MKYLDRMKRAPFILIVSFFIIFSQSGVAQELSALFIGNSYTYFPGEEADPGLPKIVKQVVESIDPTIQFKYAFSTPGGCSFEQHFKDATSSKLMNEHYDEVILQGNSIESLEMTPWFKAKGFPDVNNFKAFLPKVLDLVFQKNTGVTMFVNWGWNPRHAFLQENHPGLHFPQGSPKEGQKWCGKDKFEYQKMIDDSYRLQTQGHPVGLSFVGSAWISLQNAKLVSDDELYMPDDWSHPSVLGSFVTSLMLIRDGFHLDILKNAYYPKEVSPEKGKLLMEFLAKLK